MWKFKKAVKDDTIFIHFSKNFCFPYRTYPSKFVRGESIPTFHLFSLKGEPHILWQGEAEIGGGIYRECLGDIYCSMNGKDLYRLDENGPSLFMRGTTKGRFVGSDIYMKALIPIPPAKKISVQRLA